MDALDAPTIDADEYIRAGDSPALRDHIRDAADVVSDGLRMALFGKFTALQLMLIKVQHLRELAESGHLPDAPPGPSPSRA